MANCSSCCGAREPWPTRPVDRQMIANQPELVIESFLECFRRALMQTPVSARDPGRRRPPQRHIPRSSALPTVEGSNSLWHQLLSIHHRLIVMRVFVFASERDSDICGFTAERYGGNLPSTFAPWKALGPREMQNGDPLEEVSGGANAVLNGIRRSGFLCLDLNVM
jgi:hypothetical protein